MHQLPIWFLLLALVLPRIALLGAWALHVLVPYSLSGWLPPTLGVLVPRVLVIVLIYQDRGFSPWLLVHAIAIAAVYGGGGSKSARKRRSD